MWHQNIAGMCHGTTVSGDFFQFKSELIAAVAAAAAACQASVCVCVCVCMVVSLATTSTG